VTLPQLQSQLIRAIGIVYVHMHLKDIGRIVAQTFILHNDRVAYSLSCELNAVVTISAFLDHACVECSTKKFDQPVRADNCEIGCN
jgi:hypothetical protein